MNNYQNPHAPHIPGFVHPGQARPMGPQPGYPQPQGVYPQQQPMYPSQGVYQQQQPMYPQPQQQPMYPQPQQQPPQNFIQIIATPQGQMFIDVRNGQILGPVQNQQGRQMGAVAPYQVGVEAAASNRYGMHGVLNLPEDPHPPADNRYGNLSNLVKVTKGQPAMNIDIIESVAKAEPALQNNQSLKGKLRLGMMRFKPDYHNTPFMKKDLTVHEESVVGSSLEHLVSTLIERTHDDKGSTLVSVQPGIVIHRFYDTMTVDYEADLFQSNIEMVYKTLKRLLPEVKTRSDAVYFEAYNNWLTHSVNCFLRLNIAGTPQTQIDSFADDFNDLIKYLITSHEEQRDFLLTHMEDVMEQAILDVAAIREVGEDGTTDTPKEESIVPERVTLIYVKLLSSEIGDDGTQSGLRVANKLMTSLEDQVKEAEFFLVTMDRRIYRVTLKLDESVSINCIND